MTGSKYLKVFVDGGEIVSRILSSLSVSHSFALTMIPLLTMEFPLNVSVFFLQANIYSIS